MIVSKTKTKAMIINFSKKYQFSTRLQLKGQPIEVVNSMKTLGCIINNKLSWNENCEMLIKKVNKRMQLLRKVWSFGSSKEDMVHLWVVYCQSILEQSCVVWNSSLSQQNSQDLERTQRTFCKLMLREKFKSYELALEELNLILLSERREILCKNFANKGIINNTLSDLFPKKKRKHNMQLRKN